MAQPRWHRLAQFDIEILHYHASLPRVCELQRMTSFGQSSLEAVRHFTVLFSALKDFCQQMNVGIIMTMKDQQHWLSAFLLIAGFRTCHCPNGHGTIWQFPLCLDIAHPAIVPAGTSFGSVPLRRPTQVGHGPTLTPVGVAPTTPHPTRPCHGLPASAIGPGVAASNNGQGLDSPPSPFGVQV